MTDTALTSGRIAASPCETGACLIELAGFTHLFDRPLALALWPREIVCVTGVSGAGKTRLLRGIADLEPNDAVVSLRGTDRDTFKPAAWRQQVALVPAETAWWADTVGEHFPPDYDAAALAALGFATEVLTWNVRRLSSGERQRLGLLRALACTPPVLLLDEPTANLDAANTERVECLVRDYLDQHAAAALWVTHTPEQRARLGERVLSLTPRRWELSACP